MIDQIKRVKKLLKSNPAVEFAYLFWSQVKGTADERSDWDIAIFFKKDPQKLPRWSLFYLESEISGEVGKEVQITALNNLDLPVFLFQIINHGILIADKNTEKRILFEARALSKYHDWHYFLRRHMGCTKSAG
jgi:predicted nucleotidyltransferase